MFADNTPALAYLVREGGTRSSLLIAEAQSVLRWAEDHAIQIIPQFVKGSAKVLAGCISRRDQVFSTE